MFVTYKAFNLCEKKKLKLSFTYYYNFLAILKLLIEDQTMRKFLFSFGRVLFKYRKIN